MIVRMCENKRKITVYDRLFEFETVFISCVSSIPENIAKYSSLALVVAQVELIEVAYL